MFRPALPSPRPDMPAISVLAAALMLQPSAPLADGADGDAGCEALLSAERARVGRADDPRFEYARLYDGLGEAMARIGDTMGRGAAAFVPQLGVRVAGDPRMVLSFPINVPFGATAGCTRGALLRRHQPLRALFEPGVTLGVGPFARFGLRYVLHPRSWYVGLGVGASVGAQLDRERTWTAQPFVGPEALLHFGRCCGPGYVTLSLRPDLVVAPTVHTAWFAGLTWTWF